MNKHVIYTISSINYLHYSLTVRESFLKHNNGYDFVIFLVDKISNNDELLYIKNAVLNGVDIRFFDELENFLTEFKTKDFTTKYSILEINTAIKPYCMKYFFKKGYEKVIYIDPDIKFYSSIEKLDKILDEYDVVLTPHMMSPFPADGKAQDSQTIMHAGIYNCGFIAVKNTDNGNALADFWMEQLFDKCYVDVKNALFVDQRWADWFPSLFDKVYILKDYGYNSAYWNLHERVVTNKDGIWYSNDDKLVFYHFSGLNRKDMDKISKYQNRYKLSDRKQDLKNLFIDYLDDVNSKNADVLAKSKYYYDYIPCTNIKIEQELRARVLGRYARRRFTLFDLNTLAIKNSCLRYFWYVAKRYYRPDYLLRFYFALIYLPIVKNTFGVNVICDSSIATDTLLRLLKLLKSSGLPFCFYSKDEIADSVDAEYVANKPLFGTSLDLTKCKTEMSQITNIVELFDRVFFDK